MKNTYLLIVLIALFFIAPGPVHAEKPHQGMVKIPKGCFQMGTNTVFFNEEDRPNVMERPVHKVCLDSFYLDTHEASQEKYEKVMRHNPSFILQKDFPTDHVRLRDAMSFCARQGKRLPTEAEWEYAARAGSPKDYPWGDEIDMAYLWYEFNSARTPHPVGTRKPNKWGLHDMMGSVWEWVSDWYSESYYGDSPVNNPQGPKNRLSFRVIRGGSWLDDERYIHVTVRYRGMQDATETFLVGVRCAKSIGSK